MASQFKTTGSLRKSGAKSKARKSEAKWKSSNAKSKAAVSAPILQLPPEIVFLLVKLLDLQDQLALNRANRWFYSIINPVIYTHNVRHGNSTCLYWGAENGLLGTLQHALAAGADLNALGPLSYKTAHRDTASEPTIEIVTVEPTEDDANPGTRPRAPFCAPLHLAAKKGHRDVVKWLLDNGADIDAPSYRVCGCQPLKAGRQHSRRLSEWPRWRALHTAMCHQERSVAELLIFRGASLELDPTPGHNHTALHSAAAHGLVPIIKLLAINDVNLDVNQRDAWDNTALHYVGELWRPRDSAEIRDTITKLLALGADLEAHNENGYTPLLNACYRGNFAVAHRLVSIGANPDPHRCIPNFRDCRPLYYCMLPRADFFDVDDTRVKHDEFEGNRVTLIKALVDAGAAVNARFDKRGYRNVTPLMLACELAEARVAAALVQCGAEINAQDRNGRTPLSYACRERPVHPRDMAEMATILLRRGARMDLEEDPESCPLDCAIKRSRWHNDDVLRAMLKASGRVNLTRDKLERAMERCASSGNHRALKLLLGFARRVYTVTNFMLKDYIDRVINQQDPWNQTETFRVVMEFGSHVYTNEMLLYKTITQGNRELSLETLKRGVSVSESRFQGGQTFLHLACQWGSLDVVQALLERGADVNVFDNDLRTPLSIVVPNPLAHDVAVALMLEVADPFLVPPDDLLQQLYGDDDEDEWRYVKRRYLTAFDLAIIGNRDTLVREILSRYALPEIPRGSRFSYVHRAAQNPDPTILKMLLDKGADPRGGEDCPNPPAVSLIRRVWDQPRMPDAGVVLLKTAKILLDKYPHASDLPWELFEEIALYKTEDFDKIKLRHTVQTELEILRRPNDVVGISRPGFIFSWARKTGTRIYAQVD
jgi:ankyrin repeat protein